MIFKTCIAEDIYWEGDDAWFYVRLSSPITHNGNVFHNIIIFERVDDGVVYTVLVGCKDSAYEEVGSTPINPTPFRDTPPEDIMFSLGFNWQMEHM